MSGMADALEKRPVSTTTTATAPTGAGSATSAGGPNSSLNAWLQQGEQLYTTALNEFRALEAQIEELEARLAEKQEEVNKVAQMIGKPSVEGSRRLSAELVPAQIIEEPPARGMGGSGTSSSNATIARALTGRFGR